MNVLTINRDGGYVGDDLHHGEVMVSAMVSMVVMVSMRITLPREYILRSPPSLSSPSEKDFSSQKLLLPNRELCALCRDVGGLWQGRYWMGCPFLRDLSFWMLSRFLQESRRKNFVAIALEKKKVITK